MIGKEIETEPVVAFDIGNTNTEVAVVDLVKFKCLQVECLPSRNFARKLPAILGKIGKVYGRIPVKGSTVIRKTSRSIDQAVKTAGWGNISWVSVDRKLPIKICYKTKDTLGQDRIANCICASRLSNGADSIVIDSGTAITVDLYRAGLGFVGGVILPGIEMQYRALGQNTADLPNVKASSQMAVVPGRSTIECIKAGVELGIAGGLSSIVREMREKCGSRVGIYATGGAWSLSAKYVDFKVAHIEGMTLLGVALV